MASTTLPREFAPLIFRYLSLILTAGQKGDVGWIAFYNPTTNRAVNGVATAGLIPLGTFARDYDATSAERSCEIDLGRTVTAYPYVNASGGDAVVATDLGAIAYGDDNQTVTRTSTGRTPIGRVWKVTATTVWIEPLAEVVALPSAASPVINAAVAYTTNDYAPTAAALVSGQVYETGTTAAASTITLPDDAATGTVVTFVSNGTANGHTVTYRQDNDGTPANLTTALTASRRHSVICHKVGTLWIVNAYINAS